jgi:hypothetical protein
MQLSREIEKDIKADLKVAKKLRLHWRGLVAVMIGSFLVCLLFDHFGRFDVARPSILAAGAISFTVVVKWNLNKRTWFWLTMALIVALHVLVILSVPWTTKWVPAVVIAGFCTVDLVVMLAIVDAVETLLQRHEKQRTNPLRRT